MRIVRDLPIKLKLLLVTLATCSAALALACTALFWFQSVNFRKGFVAELESLGSVVAQNSAAPLAFKDRKSAVEVLSALTVKSHITAAGVFDSDGELFASMGTEELPRVHGEGRSLKESGVTFNQGYADLSVPVELEGGLIGHLHVRARFQDQARELLSLYAIVLATVLVGSLVVILLVSSAMQRIITGPIAALATAARNVSEKEDYTTRAPEAGRDEVGLLTRTFNQMLDQIQSRDQRLRESQQRFEVAVQGSSDGIWDWDLRTQNIYFSPRWKNMVGYAEDEMVNAFETFQALLHPEDVERVLDQIRSYLEGQETVYEVTFRLRHKDGDYRWILSRGVALRDPQGKAFRFAGSHTEITERKRAEEREWRRAERALRHQSVLYKLSRIEAAEWTDQLRTILSEIARFLNVERVSYWRLEDGKQVLARQEQFILSGDMFETSGSRLFASDFPCYFSALYQAGHPLVFDDALRDSTLVEMAPGYLIPLGITSMLDSPVSLNGQVLGVICCEHIGPRREWTTEETEFARAAAQQVALALEGHERRRAEVSLRQSEIRYRSVVESVKEVIFQTDATGAWVFLNSAWTEITGHAVADSLGLSYTEFVFLEDRARCLELISPVLKRRQEGCRGEIRFQTLTGEVRWIELLAQVTYDGEQALGGLSGTLTDITARKAAEVEMARLNRELVDTSRQAGMAEIATGVLHNVGNVLNSVNVSAALILDQMRRSKAASLAKVAQLFREHRDDIAGFLGCDAKGKQLPAFIEALSEQFLREQAAQVKEMLSLQQNIDHIKQIVAMQQSYAKVSGAMEPLNPSELVEDALRIAATALVRNQIEVVRDFEPTPRVLTDRHKVLQILVNLVSNATQAVDQRTEGRRLTLRVRTDGNGNSVRMEVADNGMGIPPENLTRIFQHGFTTKKSGHGFGLHSGANAAKEMGGSLIALSEGSGHGATFVLSLPVGPAANVQKAA